MANPARSFLLCSCTPLSEILSTPREEKPVSLTPPPQTISCGGQRNKHPRPALLWAFSDSSPSSHTTFSCPCSPSSPALMLPQTAHRPSLPATTSTFSPTALLAPSGFLLPAQLVRLDLHLSRLPANLFSITALPFAISLLILLPTCSSSY